MSNLGLNRISTQVVLVLLVGITVSHFASTAIRYGHRDEALGILESIRIAERIATITAVMEATPAAARPQATATFSRTTLQVAWDPDKAAVKSPNADPDLRPLETVINLSMGDLEPRDIRVAYDTALRQPGGDQRPNPKFPEPKADQSVSEYQEVMADLLGGRNFLVSVQLSDRSWLNIVAPFAETLPIWSPRSLLSTSILAIAVVVLAMWAVRRATAPLDAFGRAADQLGKNVNAPPIREFGPLEVRQAIRAFNLMQRRVQRYVEDRTQMLAAISHDLRTPITRLRLRSELIGDAAHRRKMFSDLDEMEAMISAVLSFAREDVDSEASETIDLVATLQTLCDNMAEMGHSVELIAEGQVRYFCRAVSIRRCFTNLIENAVKYGQCARITLSTEPAGVVVRIADRGPGIPEPLQDKVFGAFFRVEQSRNRETGGVGLGLTVARTILHAHGGNIELENRPEGGLLATVTLPYAASASRDRRREAPVLAAPQVG